MVLKFTSKKYMLRNKINKMNQKKNTNKHFILAHPNSAFRKLSSIYVFSYFPFGFEGRIWELIVSVPDHCLSFYFVCKQKYS